MGSKAKEKKMSNANNNAQNNTNAAGQGLEVLLDPRKDVIASNAGHSLDLLVRLRAPLQTGEAKPRP